MGGLPIHIPGILSLKSIPSEEGTQFFTVVGGRGLQLNTYEHSS